MSNTKISSEQIIDGVALAGNPTTTTQSAGNNTTRVATTAFVTTAVAALVDSAPAALNTLNEIAAAINDDANINTTLTNSIAAKLPLAGGTLTGDLTMGANQIIFDNNSQAIQIKDAAGTASYVLYQDNADTLIVGNNTNVEKIRFDTGGHEGALSIDTSGNVGIATTPDDGWNSNFDVLQIGLSGVLYGYHANAQEIMCVGNNFNNVGASFVTADRINTGFAQQYLQDHVGAHVFRTAVSGNANASIDWIDAMSIENNGNVGIGGTPATNTKLFVKAGTNLNFEVENASSNLRLSALNDARSANVGMQFASSGFEFLTGNVKINNGNLQIKTIGQIEDNGTRLLLRSTGDASGLRFDGGGYTPFKNGSAANGTVDLGFSGGRFKDLHLSGVAKAGDGTYALPSLSFSSDPNTGLYRPSSDNLGFAIGATARAFMSNSQFNVDAKIVATELDINGNADVSGTLGVTGNTTHGGHLQANDGFEVKVEQGEKGFTDATSSSTSNQADYQVIVCQNILASTNTWYDVAFVTHSPTIDILGRAVANDATSHGGVGVVYHLLGMYGSVSTHLKTTQAYNNTSSFATDGTGLLYQYRNGGASSGAYRLQVKANWSNNGHNAYVYTTVRGMADGTIYEDD